MSNMHLEVYVMNRGTRSEGGKKKYRTFIKIIHHGLKHLILLLQINVANLTNFENSFYWIIIISIKIYTFW